MDERVLCLTDRLRGRYVLDVNDGAGSLNGSNRFVRNFDTPPIQHEAAKRIEHLESIIEVCRQQFLLYADNHLAKNTPESLEKARTNQRMAELCQSVLDS